MAILVKESPYINKTIQCPCCKSIIKTEPHTKFTGYKGCLYFHCPKCREFIDITQETPIEEKLPYISNIVTTCNSEYKVTFYHSEFISKNKDNPEKEIPPRFTQCNIFIKEDNGEFRLHYLGKAVCNPRDNFSKSIGRKIAFTKAIDLFNREVREIFWKWFNAKEKQ